MEPTEQSWRERRAQSRYDRSALLGCLPANCTGRDHSWAVCLPTVLVATMAVLHDPTECVTGNFPAGLQRIAPEVAAALEPCIAELPLTGLGGRGHLMSV